MPATLTAQYVTINATHQSIALEKFEGDLDTLQDWISGLCMEQEPRGEWALRFPGRMEDAHGADLLQVALFGVAGATDEERLAALKLLEQRYRADKADYLRQLEDEAAEEFA